MNNDDIDYEKLTRGRKKSDAMLVDIVKNGFAPLVLADTVKNASLSKDIKIKDAWKKSMEKFPDSVYDNAVEGIDVVSSHAPEFTRDNPNLASALGMGLDIIDPYAYGLTKLGKASKLPLTLAQGTMHAADKWADTATENWVKKLVKKKDMVDVPKIVDYIKRKELRGELRNSEKLIHKIDGKYGLDGVKVADGTLDEMGQKIVGTVRKADRQGATPINRGEIFNKMKRKVVAENNDPNVSGITKEGPYTGKLREVIKPFKRERIIIDGKPVTKPDLIPAIPDETEALIGKLSKEAETVKKNKASQAAQKAERAKAEKEVASEVIPDNKSEVDAMLKAQKKERQAAESSVAKENSSIKSENDKVDQQLIDLLLKKKMATEEVSPMDMIPVPKAQKGLPPIPAREALDIQLHNKKAAIANKKYLEKGELESSLPSIEEQITMLKNTEKKGLKEVEVPPAIPEEAAVVVPPFKKPLSEVEVPPAIPNEAVGRDLETVLAELADAKSKKANLAHSNNKIKGENTDALKNYGIESKINSPKVDTKDVARISNLEDMWSLKVDARKKLRNADFDQTIKNLPEHKAMVVEATNEIDNKIIDSLKDINFVEGNAADIYKALNQDFGTQSDFLELVIDHTLNKWKGGKSRGGAIPALTGGVAAAISAKTLGGSLPLSVVAGSVTGEAARRGFGLSPEIAASIGDRISKRPFEANIATQIPLEIAEIAGEGGPKVTNREVENQQVAPAEDVSISHEDMSPELLKSIQGRHPQSVEEAPPQDHIEQKMDETLSPVKPTWDPYINEEVLNTFLPRDSKRILANPSALIAKVQQVAPNQVGLVKEMLENDPETMKEAGPKIAMMFPTIFEKDKYGAFDGVIIDPMMKQKFLADLSQDEEMDSIEKAKMALKVNRGESIHS